MMLGENDNSILEVGDCLHHLLLLSAELSCLFLSQESGLLQGLLVLMDLPLESLDLSAELTLAGGSRLHLGHQVGNPTFSDSNVLCLLLLVGLAPAHHFIVHFGLLVPFGHELCPHLLQEQNNSLDRALWCRLGV